MNTPTTFQRGDRVRHEGRPEWGQGVVDEARGIRHEGRPAQRLVIRFEHHGRTTVSTAFARIVPAEARSGSGQDVAPPPAEPGDWLSEHEPRADTADPLTTLPDAAADPLRPLARRLTATLDLYRFGDDPRGLIEWAVAQTGMHDPLSQYTRHDLERAYPRFQRDRDQHLRILLKEARRENERDLIEQAKRHRMSAAREAVRRIL